MSHEVLEGPIFRRMYQLDRACESKQGHKHNYDHVTLVLRGRLKVLYSYEKDGKTVEGEAGEFGQGESVTILKHVHHTLIALEDNTIYVCVFSHRDFDGVVVERYVGNTEAYC